MESNSANSFTYEFQSNKPGMVLKSSAKVIILNVYSKLREQNARKSEREIVEMCSELTGVSATSIFGMKAEWRDNGKFSTPGKKRPFKVGTQTRMQKYDDFAKTAIRRIVHSFYFRNEIPTALKIMHAIHEDKNLPNFGVRTVRNIMKDLGFVFKKRNRCSILMERADIQRWRHEYLRKILRYRSENRKIYYTDETWVNVGHTKTKVWQDSTIKSHKQAFLNGLSPGLKAPSGKGARIILIHAGNEEGFVDGCAEVFKARKNVGDYHAEMNGTHYEEWFRKLLLKLKKNSRD